MKKLYYVGNSQKIIKRFSEKAIIKIYSLLKLLRLGLSLQPKEFKYMPTIGKGVYEIRVKIRLQCRVFYVSNVKGLIYVLHAFVKKTEKTSKKDIEIGIQRYKELVRILKGQED